MSTVEADVVRLLDTCRMFSGVPTTDDLRLFSGLSGRRLWAAGQILSRTGLLKPGVPNDWPTNEAVLEKYREQAVFEDAKCTA